MALVLQELLPLPRSEVKRGRRHVSGWGAALKKPLNRPCAQNLPGFYRDAALLSYHHRIDIWRINFRFQRLS